MFIEWPPDFKGTYLEIKWICGHCNAFQVEYIDRDFGPSDEFLCENCNKTTLIENVVEEKGE